MTARTVGLGLGLIALATAIACTEAGVTREVNLGGPSGSGGTPRLTAPSLETPNGDVQLNTLRPTFTVRNGSSDQAGTRTYEIQVSDRQDFSAAATGGGSVQTVVAKAGIPEGAGGTTSATLDQDLQPTTRMFWRARLTQGNVSSEWSDGGTFKTKMVGFNRPGELFDPLIHSETVGTIVGSTTFVDGVGLRLEGGNSYVRYQLPQTISAGEFSMEVKGLRPNGPGDKLKIFSMLDGTGDLLNSKYQAAVHYRGIGGNPDNCIAFKAVWGDSDIRLEPDAAKRSASIMNLDPNKTYFVQAIWTSNSFRVVIKDGGINGSVIYDYTIFAPGGTGPYAPSPHFAYLGSNNGPAEVASWPGVTYWNVWLANHARPASLGSALTAR